MTIYRVCELTYRNGCESSIYYVSSKAKADKKVADLLDYYKSQGYADEEYEVFSEEYTIDEMMAEDADLVDMELDADKPEYIDVEILDIIRR